MDSVIHPPMRLQPISSTSISTRNTQKQLEIFLDDFQARTTASQGGNTAVTVQLQKLKDALQEERHKKDAARS
ncbi:hypothetical protein BDZ94DRAFT_265755 [Collybia nuda]|uniref:Uncharacterized protein n=1 Tax=Collybia nuda TaxID=64659 RepID=A0A9P5XX23_9AGAR|nr:hypothetical protein BDZ94DRAFT_265755 [Collybia nuda]